MICGHYSLTPCNTATVGDFQVSSLSSHCLCSKTSCLFALVIFYSLFASNTVFCNISTRTCAAALSRGEAEPRLAADNAVEATVGVLAELALAAGAVVQPLGTLVNVCSSEQSQLSIRFIHRNTGYHLHVVAPRQLKTRAVGSRQKTALIRYKSDICEEEAEQICLHRCIC